MVYGFQNACGYGKMRADMAKMRADMAWPHLSKLWKQAPLM